jgi:hypothetical protein
MISIPLHLIELEQESYHILVGGRFRDGQECFWIIDTGASKSVMDINLKEHYTSLDPENEEELLSAGINQGMVDTAVGVLKYLALGAQLVLRDQKVALIDLAHVNQIYSRYSDYKIAGLIGGDVLKQLGTIINYADLEIHFSRLSECPNE